jgi:hypothetical protein
MRNVSDKLCRENQKTHFVGIFFWLGGGLEYHAIYEIMWENIVEWDRP